MPPKHRQRCSALVMRRARRKSGWRLQILYRIAASGVTAPAGPTMSAAKHAGKPGVRCLAPFRPRRQRKTSRLLSGHSAGSSPAEATIFGDWDNGSPRPWGGRSGGSIPPSPTRFSARGAWQREPPYKRLSTRLVHGLGSIPSGRTSFGTVGQRSGRLPVTQENAGSNPVGPASFARIA